MSDMYEKISRPADRPKRRRGAAIFVLLAAALIAIVICSLWAWRLFSVRPQFYRFVAALSESTVYAYEHDSLQAEADGQLVRVSGDNAYAIYGGLSSWTPGRLLFRAPDGPADLLLDYGDGSRLQLWNVKKNGQVQAHGAYLLFESGAGERFLFEFQSANPSLIIRQALLANNEPWEES